MWQSSMVQYQNFVLQLGESSIGDLLPNKCFVRENIQIIINDYWKWLNAGNCYGVESRK